GNITSTAEDVIRHVNKERSVSAHSGTPSLPPTGIAWPYKVGDFINVESAFGNNWNGTINFATSSMPSGANQFTTLDRSLANVMKQGHHLSYGAEYASLTTSLKHTNNDISFTAVDKGAAGEKIAVEYVAGLGVDSPPSVNVYNDVDGTKRISITLGTDAAGAINTTAADIVDLVNKHPVARDLVYAQTPKDQTGLGLVKEMGTTYLDRSGSFELVTYDEEGEASIYRITVDPTDTLQDVVGRIGTTFDSGVLGLRAEVVVDQHGYSSLRLIANSESGVEYGFRNDTSGALAVLGLNNIFTGDSSSNVGVNQQIMENPGLLGAGLINSDGIRTVGSNVNALDMADLKDKRFDFSKVGDATLGTAFNTFYADIGST
ncbi:MAG: hypothetical protein ACRCTY_01230, partial [Candidatus Adiutrix sp.]